MTPVTRTVALAALLSKSLRKFLQAGSRARQTAVVGIGLEQIGEAAGVSSATVSRVLNNRAGVAETTRAKVLAALDEMGYDPPPRLVPRGTGLVGLVVPEMTNPVFPWLAQAVTAALERRGLTSLLCVVVPGGTQEDAYVAQLLDRQVSAVVVVAGAHAVVGSDPTRYTRLMDRGLPLVLVNGWHDGVPAPFVSNDEGSRDRGRGRAPRRSRAPARRAGGRPAALPRGPPAGGRVSAPRCTATSGPRRTATWWPRPASASRGGRQAAARLLEGGGRPRWSARRT